MAKRTRSDEGRRGPQIGWFNLIGFLLLAIAYVSSLVQMYRVNKEEYASDQEVIRIVHWQLERGIREAFEKQFRIYEEMQAREGRKVRVIQEPIPEQAYGQYVRTNMIGGTMPDVIEFGKITQSARDIVRYYRPLTEEVMEPNPYNKGTDLEGIPWRETFFDNLKASYRRELQDYYTVGMSAFTVRLYYNADKLETITGSKDPPSTFQEFMDVCQEIQEYDDPEFGTIQPIAASRNSVGDMEHILATALMGDITYVIDYDWSGELTRYERFRGYLNGDIDLLGDPNIVLGHEIVKELSQYFPPGFMAVERAEASRAFQQGRGVFLLSGSWDIPSLQFKTEFELSVTDFPLPTEDDPVYGEYYDGRGTEADLSTGFPFGVARSTPYFDLTIDFLRYITSLKVNEEFNKDIRWIPVIRGAEVDDFLEPFRPYVEGFSEPQIYEVSWRDGEIFRLHEKLYWPYIQGDMEYEEYARSFLEDWASYVATDIERGFEEDKRNRLNNRFFRTAFRGRSMSNPNEKEAQRDLARVRTVNEHYNSATFGLARSALDLSLDLQASDLPIAADLRKQLHLAGGELYAP